MFQEVELKEDSIDKGFEDIFKNKTVRYGGRLGDNEESIGLSDESSENSDDELNVLAQPGVDLSSRRKSKKLRYDDSFAIFFELSMIFDNTKDFGKDLDNYVVQEKV